MTWSETGSALNVMGSKHSWMEIVASATCVAAGLSSCASKAPALEPKDERVFEPPAAIRNEQGADAHRSEWPRQFKENESLITIYQPQVVSWSKGEVEERAVISVQTGASAQPVYGRIWIHARPQEDDKNQSVKFENVRMTRASFPSAPELAALSLKVVGRNTVELLNPITRWALE